MENNKIQEKTLELLKKIDWPITTEQVAEELKISWNTAQIHLLKLVAKGQVKYKKVGRQNQFWLNRKYKEEFK